MRNLTSEELQHLWATVARPPKESVEIYEQVEELRRQLPPKASRQEAFRRLAESSGRSLGSISTNYYREARRREQVSRQPGRQAGSSSPRGRLDASELERIASQLSELASRLVDLVAQEQQELAAERQRIEKAKQAIIDA